MLPASVGEEERGSEGLGERTWGEVGVGLGERTDASNEHEGWESLAGHCDCRSNLPNAIALLRYGTGYLLHSSSGYIRPWFAANWCAVIRYDGHVRDASCGDWFPQNDTQYINDVEVNAE